MKYLDKVIFKSDNIIFDDLKKMIKDSWWWKSYLGGRWYWDNKYFQLSLAKGTIEFNWICNVVKKWWII